MQVHGSDIQYGYCLLVEKSQVEPKVVGGCIITGYFHFLPKSLLRPQEQDKELEEPFCSTILILLWHDLNTYKLQVLPNASHHLEALMLD